MRKEVAISGFGDGYISGIPVTLSVLNNTYVLDLDVTSSGAACIYFILFDPPIQIGDDPYEYVNDLYLYMSGKGQGFIGFGSSIGIGCFTNGSITMDSTCNSGYRIGTFQNVLTCPNGPNPPPENRGGCIYYGFIFDQEAYDNSGGLEGWCECTDEPWCGATISVSDYGG